ncbi:MAG: tetratricopeptide repeat protein [Planctomycetota bacterium]|jgi:tetratricopeptide (TPR) repeat protein
MSLLPQGKMPGFFTIVFLSNIVFLTVPGQGQLRKINVGDKMPEFSLPVLTVPSGPNDPNKEVFTYKHNRERVLGLVLLSSNQSQSKRAVADIEKIAVELDKKDVSLDFVGVINKQMEKGFGESRTDGSAMVFPVLLDEEYKLWGKLGVIAKPTVLVVGKDDTVLWIKAGYGYDFAPSLRDHLNQALGITEKKIAEGLTEVRTLKNDSTQGKVKRHLKIARGLEEKGRFESAIAQVHKARELDPNSIDAALAIGELYCRVGESHKALDVIAKIKTTKRFDKAQLFLISGWAKRQLGELESAEKFLLEAVSLRPKSSRVFYELGKIYQATGQTEKAMQAFHKALAIIFAEPVETDSSAQ